MGVRPEHFEDAALVDAAALTRGATFDAQIEVLESMGSEKYAYFSVEGGEVQASDLADLAADAGSAGVPDSGSQVITRLSAASTVAEGQPAKFWFDTDKIQLFAPDSGANLTYSED